MTRNIILIISVLLAAVSCTTTQELNEELLQRSEISMTWKSEVQLSYNPLTYQLGHNEARNEYRVYDDLLGNWLVVKCSAKPSYEGQTLTADVTWTTSNNIKRGNDLEFTVQKMDDSGMIWMWNNSSKIGLVIKNL